MIILALDPGRNKTGFAFVDFDGRLLASGIFLTDEREKFFDELESSSPKFLSWLKEGSTENFNEPVSLIIIGNGTTSGEFSLYVQERASCEIIPVDEKNTTLEARELYWKIHRPGLITRLLPEGLRVPKRTLDDLAAWAVALRGLKKYRDIRRNRL